MVTNSAESSSLEHRLDANEGDEVVALFAVLERFPVRVQPHHAAPMLVEETSVAVKFPARHAFLGGDLILAARASPEREYVVVRLPPTVRMQD